MNFNVKKLIPVLYAVSAVFILGGIALLCFAVPFASSAFFGVTIGIFAGLSLALGGLLIYFIFICRDEDANFFLYDRKSGSNIQPSELTFDRVNSRMGYFMSQLSASQEQSWQGNLFATVGDRFGVNGVYKPLVAYKMLYDLVQLDRPEVWQLFTSAEPTLIHSMCDALASVEEHAMAKTLVEAYEAAETVADVEWVRDFLMGNAKYFRRRMMDYVQARIDLFY